jgi:hypothetical protein
VGRGPEGNTTRNQDKQTQQSLSASQIDPKLLITLREDQDIVLPFAWAGLEADGSVLGITKEGKLRGVRFVRTENGYTLKSLATETEQKKRIEKSGSLDIQGYAADDEFPFQSDILNGGNCRAHMVLAWRANHRSFSGRSSDTFDLAWPVLRMIVERDNRVVTNNVVRLDFLNPGEAFIQDVNGDGQQDYVFIGYYQTATMYIWSLDAGCLVKPLEFISWNKGEINREHSVDGRNIFLRKTSSGNGFTIHVESPVPLKLGWIVEELYTWNERQRAFERISVTERKISLK